MNLKEINDLISIRQYIAQSIDNMSLHKDVVKYYQQSLVLIDLKISSLIKSDQFKEYINYGDVNKAMQDVKAITNIRTGMKPIER